MVIDFNRDRINKNNYQDLPKEYIFDLFLAFQTRQELLARVNIDALMMSLAKYKDLKRYSFIYKNISSEKNEFGIEIINLKECIDKNLKEKKIIINPKNDKEVFILSDRDSCNAILSKYDKELLKKIDDLFFRVYMDLKVGIDKWSLICEDEFIDVPNYPSIVTAEFLEQDKQNPIVKKKIKKRAIEHLKSIYGQNNKLKK